MIPFDVKSPLSSDFFSQIFAVIRSIKQQFKERFSLDHNLFSYLYENTELYLPLVSDALDISGNGNNGTATDITWTGGVANFNGTSSKIVPSLSIPNLTGYSISFKFKRNGAPTVNERLIMNYVDANNRTGFFLSPTTGRLSFINIVASSEYTTTYKTTNLCDNIEHHVVINFIDSSNIQIFVDGVEDTIKTMSVLLTTFVSPVFYIGTQVSSSYFTGTLSNLYIFNRALTDAERTWLYSNNLKDSLDPTSPSADGFHNKLTMPEYVEYDNMGTPSYVPTHLINSNQIFVDKIDGLHELCVRKDDGIYQLTKNGDIYYKVYTIGEDGPAGGIVFYDKGYVSDGWRYMEVSKTDVSSQWWSNIETVACGASGISIGTGLSNSNLIKNQSGHIYSIANNCRNFNGGGYSDWFLGSRNELLELIPIISSLNLGRNYINSSSETSASSFYVYQISSSLWLNSSKHSMGPERPIRYFKSTVKFVKIG